MLVKYNKEAGFSSLPTNIFSYFSSKKAESAKTGIEKLFSSDNTIIDFSKTTQDINELIESTGVADETFAKFIKDAKDSNKVFKSSGEMLKSYSSYLGKVGAKAVAAEAGTIALNVAMKALSTIGWTLLISSITSAITAFATSEDRLAEAAQEAGQAFASDKQNIEDYKTKISDLYTVINDENSSYEQVTDARKQLLSIQNDLIDNYGDEKDAIDIVTDAINGQAGALDRLTASKWQSTVDDFNKSDGFWNKFADSAKNSLGHYNNNFERMIGEMENSTISFDMVNYNTDNFKEFEALLKSLYGVEGVISDYGEKTYTISGNLDDIYGKLQNIKDLANSYGIEQTSGISDALTEVNSKLDEYQSLYDQYVLNDVIFKNSDYTDYFKSINEAYSKYEEAFNSGVDEDIEKATQEYASIVSNIINSISDSDENKDAIVEYFSSMYPVLQAEVDTWKFKAKITPSFDTYDSETDSNMKEDLAKFSSAEDLLNFKPDASNNQDKVEAYERLKSIAKRDFHNSLDALVDAAVEFYGLRTQAALDFLDRIGANNGTGAGFGNTLSNSESQVNPTTAEEWFDKLSNDEKNLANSQAFEQALERQKEKLDGATLSANDYDKALADVIASQKKVSKDKTKSEMIDTINGMSDGFDILDKIYADVKDGDVFDFTNLDSKKFEEAFSGLKDEYTEFIEKVSSSPNDIKGCQDAFNNLVTAWIESKGILGEITEDTASLTASMLDNMGVVNAEEVVNYQLAASRAYAAETGKDLNNATLEELTAFAQEADLTDVARASLANYVIQKIKAASITITTSADIANITSLCTQLGVAGRALEAYARLKAIAMDTSGKYTDGYKEYAATSADQILQNAVVKAQEKYVPQVKYNGADTTNKTSKSGSSSKNYETELKKQLESIKTEYEKGSITLDEYYEKSLSLIKQYYDEGKIEASDFYDNNKSLLDDYLKYLEIAYKRGSMSYGEYFAKYLKAVQDCYDKGAISTEEYWNYNKELLDDYVDSAKKILDNLYDHKSMQAAGVSDLKQYLTTCYEMIKSFYDQGKISAYDYYNYLSDFYDYQISVYDKVIDAVTNKLDDQIDALEKQKDQIEKNYKAQIDVLEKEKDALEAGNDARKDAIDLQKALYEMNRAQNQRTDLVYKDGQMVYVADQQGIRDKKDELDDLEYQRKIKEIEKQISSLEKTMDSLTDGIDQQIEDLNNYKDQWEDVKNKFIEQQNELLAEQIIGKDWEIDIQNMRMEALVEFTNKYIAMQQAQADAAVAAANKIVEAQRSIAAMQNTTPTTISTPSTSSSSSGGSKGNNKKNTTSKSNNIKAEVRSVVSPGYKTSGEASSKISSYNGNGVMKKNGKWYVYKKYASGTDNAEKGWHIVSEDNIGDEIVIDNNGNAFIPHGEQLYNFEGGEKVIKASETKKILDNEGNYIPLYSKVTTSDSFSNITNAFANSPMYNSNKVNGVSSISKFTQAKASERSVSLSIGDIVVQGVQDVNGLVKAVKQRFPNSLLQELMK